MNIDVYGRYQNNNYVVHYVIHLNFFLNLLVFGSYLLQCVGIMGVSVFYPGGHSGT